MQSTYQPNSFEMITRYLKPAITGAWHCLELLANQFRVQFMNTGHRLAGSSRQVVRFV